MTDAILISELIYSVLTSSNDLCEYISDKTTKNNVVTYSNHRVWPLVAPYTKPEDIIYPFVIFTKTNISSVGMSKDGYYSDLVTFQISVESPIYLDTLYIANIIRHLFENQHIVYNTLLLSDIRMTNIVEMFTSETFIQTLTFNCDVENA